MINVFLSASIPLPSRDPRFIETADVVLIREAIKSLVSIIVPHGQIIFGGHPAITPLVSNLLTQMDSEYRHRVILYQSKYFETGFIKEKDEFVDLRLTDIVESDREKSLELMRSQMIETLSFDAGVFIGGMEGIFDEYAEFKDANPNAFLYPIASTGAASLELYNEHHQDNTDLLNELCYPVLFRKLIKRIESNRVKFNG